MWYVLGLRAIMERHKVAQFKDYQRVWGDPQYPTPLIILWRQTKTRLMRGTDWMTQAVHPIEESSGISLEEIRKETDTADRESERQMHPGEFLTLT